MHLSKFEQQIFATLPKSRFFAESRGNRQREKIPRTTRIKRDWKRSKSPLSLKAWVRKGECSQDDVGEWLKAK